MTSSTAHVPTGADLYRVDTTILVPATAPDHDQLLQPLRLPPMLGGFGAVLLEAALRCALLAGPIEHVRDIRDQIAAGTAVTLDDDAGRWYRGWPTTPAWRGYLPSRPWNAAAVGIVAELPDGPVVYEDLDVDRGHRVIQWHCLVCHASGPRYLNKNALSRCALGQLADRHARAGHCPNRAAAAACRARRTCARIRQLRAD